MKDEKKMSFTLNACRQVNVILMLLVLVFGIVKVELPGFIYPIFGLVVIVTTAFLSNIDSKNKLDTLIFAVIFIILLVYLF